MLRSIAKQVIPEALVRSFREAATRRAFDASRLRCELRRTTFYDPAINAAYEMDARLLPTKDLAGGVNLGDRRALYCLTMSLATRVLEVGTHVGASTAYIARALKRTGGQLVTVDVVDVNTEHGPWKRQGAGQSPADLMKLIDCQDTVTFVQSPAQRFMAACRERFDLIFLDGDHSKDAVYSEVALALKILNPDGVILLHDYYPEQCGIILI